MFALELNFRNRGKAEEDALLLATSYVSALAKNGNILSDWVMTTNGAEWRVHAVAPDRGAFKRSAQSSVVLKYSAQLKAAKVSVSRVRFLNRLHEVAEVCRCGSPAAYYLFTTFLHIEPSVRCMNCSGIVPLYHLPPLAFGDYSALLSWQADYRACDTLQMNCTVGERFAEREMSALNSSLTKSGLKVCREIEGLTGRPVYYYLYRAKGRNRAAEMKRTCPSCGGIWLLAEPLHGKFDFKCDTCHLLSNVAWKFR